MSLNGHFSLNSVLRRYVWSSEAWLSKLGYTCTLKLIMNVVGELYTEKNRCGIARIVCDSTAFLFQFYVLRLRCRPFGQCEFWIAYQFLQGVSIACYAEPCISYDRVVRPSVCLSVCPSVTRRHWVKKTQAMITNLHPRTLILAIKSSSRNSKGFTQSDGVKWEFGRKNSQFFARKSPYLRNGARYDQSYY